MVKRARSRRPRSHKALSELLAAIAEGRLAVDETLAALADMPDFGKRIRQLVTRAASREARRVEVHRALEPHERVMQSALLRLRASVPPEVYVGRGRHYKRGMPTGEFGLVAYVAVKRPIEQLPVEQRIPRVVHGGHDGRRYRLRVDVKPIPHAHKQASVRPGNHATVRTNTMRGVLSGIVEVSGQYAALLSGHVAQVPGAEVLASSINGSEIVLGVAGEVRDDATMDAAVVNSVNPDEVGLLSLSPAELRDVSTIHASIEVAVACADGVVRNTYIEDIDTPVSFADGSMIGLIGLRPCVTVDGDSGAVVRDRDGKIVGFVVGGSAANTFIISGGKVLHEMLAL